MQFRTTQVQYITKLKPQAELKIGPSTLHELRTLSHTRFYFQYFFCSNERQKRSAASGARLHERYII